MEQNIPGKGKATASLVLGIISLVCGIFGSFLITALIGIGCGIAGIILGSQAKKELPEGYPSGTAKGGLICSIIGLVLSAIVFVACVICAGAIGAAGAAGYGLDAFGLY